MGFDEEAIHFANHECGLHVFRCSYTDFFADGPVLVLVMNCRESVIWAVVPVIRRVKKHSNCIHICVVYRKDPVVVIRGGNDIMDADFATTDALDLGAKVCPFCGG